MIRKSSLASLPSALRTFLQGQTGSGALLIAASALALLLVNAVPGADHLYHALLHAPLGYTLSSKIGEMTPHLWINDGLMAIFFFVVGLEIKREWLVGRLSSRDQRILPIIAALAGMIVPAIVYLTITSGNRELATGWAIPAATDIAFALGILALLGSRAPPALKLLLTTIAIVDDMGAVAIIAIAYTSSIDGAALLAAGVVFALMMTMNRSGVKALWPYLLTAAALWLCILQSGIHATIAGVLAAFTIPIRTRPGASAAGPSPLHRLEHGLSPWSSALIIPLFGFANAGIRLGGENAPGLLTPLPLGVALGLFLGKQLGIFGAIWTCVRTGIAQPPRGATWLQIHGLALLCGIGFTMSLFIAGLAFPGRPELGEDAKIGIMAGSFASALCGFMLLRLAPLHAGHLAAAAEMDQESDADGDVRH